ncbi:hypothetical protein J6590_075083 [Homalodisca vitripennis]|nr:hypothetical protein J6590_075083 [Homalodisca vitripennis]
MNTGQNTSNKYIIRETQRLIDLSQTSKVIQHHRRQKTGQSADRSEDAKIAEQQRLSYSHALTSVKVQSEKQLDNDFVHTRVAVPKRHEYEHFVYANSIPTLSYHETSVATTTRRKIADVMLLHKIVNGAIDCPDLLTLLEFRAPRATRSQDMFCRRASPSLYIQHSAIPRLMREGNELCRNVDFFWFILSTFPQHIDMLRQSVVQSHNKHPYKFYLFCQATYQYGENQEENLCVRPDIPVSVTLTSPAIKKLNINNDTYFLRFISRQHVSVVVPFADSTLYFYNAR